MTMRLLLVFCIAGYVLSLPANLRAIDARQLSSLLPEGMDLDPNVPTPEAYLGWSIGNQHVRHHEVVGYAQQLCDVSDRLTWIPYGRTWGNRPLGIVACSRPDRQQRLDEVAAEHRAWAFSDYSSAIPSSATDPAGLPALPRGTVPPSIAWLGYSIHGDEASGTNACLLFLYVLAAARGDWIDTVLDQHLLLIDPCFNPDGNDRFAAWVNDHRGLHPASDPNDIEHQQGWPRGRTNHYNFDLNRDWLPATQPESQGRLKLYHHWLPNLLLDFHEMGTEQSLFFQPGVEGRDHPLSPAFVRDITQGFAKRYARVSDAASERFFTQERYDDFYPGKGSTYPDLHGSVGILVEQGSTRGLIHDYAGGVRRFSETILNPFRLSLATVEGLVEFHRPLMEYQRDFYGSARSQWLNQSPPGYLIRIPADRRLGQQWIQFLRHHDIELYGLSRGITFDNRRLQPSDWWVLPSDQKHGLFVHAMMDRTKSFPFRTFYDVSAWNMADAFGVEWLPLTSDFDPGLLSPPIQALEAFEDRLPRDEQGVAIAIPGRSLNTIPFIHACQQLGGEVRWTEADCQVTTVEGRAYRLAAGSLILHRDDHGSRWPAIRRRLGQLIKEFELEAIAVASSLTPTGPDLGSENVPRIRSPRMAMLIGTGTNITESGSLWFTIDRSLGLPISRIEPDQLTAGNLADYNLLFLPDGERSRVSSEQLATLREWVAAGGDLVLLGGSNAYLASLLDEPVKATPSQPLLSESAGVILEAKLNSNLWWKSGVTQSTIRLFQSESLWPIAGESILKLSDSPLVAGYLRDSELEKIAGKAVMARSKVGNGYITAITFNPTFRGHYWGTIGLLREVIYRKAD
jgi:hypothetical protein